MLIFGAPHPLSDRMGHPARVYGMQISGAAAKKIAGYIDEHRNALVSLFSDLVRIPSVFPPGEYAAVSERMKKELEAAGVRGSRARKRALS